MAEAGKTPFLQRKGSSHRRRVYPLKPPPTPKQSAAHTRGALPPVPRAMSAGGGGPCTQLQQISLSLYFGLNFVPGKKLLYLHPMSVPPNPCAQHRGSVTQPVG